MIKTPVPETSAESTSSSPKINSPRTRSPKLISNSKSIDRQSWRNALAGMPLEVEGKSNGPRSSSEFKRVQLPKIPPKKQQRIISLPKYTETPEKFKPPRSTGDGMVSYIDIRNTKKKWLASINAKVVMEDSFHVKDLRN